MHIPIEHVNAINDIIRTAEKEIYATTGQTFTLYLRSTVPDEVTIEGMLLTIANALGMKAQDYEVQTRRRDYLDLRRLGAYFIRKQFPTLSYTRIGELMGGQDHSTIINAIRQAEALVVSEDAAFLDKYNRVNTLLSKYISTWLTESR